MLKEFNVWSKLTKTAKEELYPDLGLREWDDIPTCDKEKMWKYLDRFFCGDEDSLVV